MLSYSICRVSKIKSAGVTGIQIHDRREKESVSHTNKEIDWGKTKENVCLLNQNEKFKTIVQNRIDSLNLKRALRKDATVMAQCLITSDKAFFDKMNKEQKIEFFKKSFDFISERYGKENMVSANIHFDEKTPHMHINFVPITKDNRVSARDLFSPEKLRALQDDFNKFCNRNNYELERGELNTKRKHLSVEEYKLETKKNEVEKTKMEFDKTYNALKSDFKTVRSVKSNIDDIEQLETKKTLLGGYMKLKKDDYEKLIAMSKQGVYNYTQNFKLHVKIESLEKKLASALQSRSIQDELKDIKLKEYDKLLTKCDNLSSELKKANREGEAMYDILKKHNLITETQKYYESMVKAEKVAEKVLRQSHDMER